MRTPTYQIFSLALIVSVLLCSPVLAQVTTGSILGSVHDATGAVVPGASITVTDVGKGTVTKVQSDAEGSYSVGFLSLERITSP